MTLFASWITTTSNDSMGFTWMRGKNEEKNMDKTNTKNQ